MRLPLVIVAAVLATTLLTSCATTPPPKAVYLTKTSVLNIPVEFKTTTPIAPPTFTPEEFGAMTPDQREAALFKYNDELRYQVHTSNLRTKKLADWEMKQRILYQSDFDQPIDETSKFFSIR